MSTPPPLPPPSSGGQPLAPPQAPHGMPPTQGVMSPYGPAPAPDNVAPGGGATVALHLRRALDWNMNEVPVAPREREQLSASGVVGPRLQGLLSWRRSSLLLALPVLLFTVILSIWEVITTETTIPVDEDIFGVESIDMLTGFGKLWIWLPTVAVVLVPLGAAIAIKRWTEMRKTSKILVMCWVGSIAIPLLAAIVPLEFILRIDAIVGLADNANVDSDQRTVIRQLLEGSIEASRVQLALQYAMALLPIIISVPAGVMKGALRVKTVFPAAVLPGWFLVSVAPFYSLFMIVMFVLIEQVVGNILLVIGVGLLAFGPWLYVIYRSVYSRPMSHAEASVELGRASRLSRWITLGGLACLVVYAATAKIGGVRVVGTDEESVFTYLDVSKSGLEVFARGLATTVVFSLIFMGMVYAEWRNAQTMTDEVRREHEAEMTELLRFAQVGAGPLT